MIKIIKRRSVEIDPNDGQEVACKVYLHARRSNEDRTEFEKRRKTTPSESHPYCMKASDKE